MNKRFTGDLDPESGAKPADLHTSEAHERAAGDFLRSGAYWFRAF